MIFIIKHSQGETYFRGFFAAGVDIDNFSYVAHNLYLLFCRSYRYSFYFIQNESIDSKNQMVSLSISEALKSKSGRESLDNAINPGFLVVIAKIVMWEEFVKLNVLKTFIGLVTIFSLSSCSQFASDQVFDNSLTRATSRLGNVFTLGGDTRFDLVLNRLHSSDGRKYHFNSEDRCLAHNNTHSALVFAQYSYPMNLQILVSTDDSSVAWISSWRTVGIVDYTVLFEIHITTPIDALELRAKTGKTKITIAFYDPKNTASGFPQSFELSVSTHPDLIPPSVNFNKVCS